jgi:hypothetical protein
MGAPWPSLDASCPVMQFPGRCLHNREEADFGQEHLD